MPTWPLTSTAKQAILKSFFSKRAIDCSQPAFCDQPAFLQEERKNPLILKAYAQFIEAQEYSREYLDSVQPKIEVTAEAVRAAVASDGRLGACVDASGMLGRMLDELGIWNYVAKSTLTIKFPGNLGPRYFWGIDEGEFTAPHAIVVAPPFSIIDSTIYHQPYEREQAALVPKIVLAETFQAATWTPEDIANNEVRSYLKRRGIAFTKFLRDNHPNMASSINDLPPRQIYYADTNLKYVIVAVGGATEKLEALDGYRPCGRTASEIFRDDVLPKLGT